MPQGVAADASTELPAPVGNRPAQDARQVNAPTELDGDWKGGDDATDFLGLDLEVAGTNLDAMVAPADSAQAVASQPNGTAADESASSSWLLSLNAARADQAVEEPAAPEAFEEQPLEVPSAEEAEGLEEAATAADDSAWADRVGPRKPVKSNKKRGLVAVLALVLAAAGVGYYQMQMRKSVAPVAPLVANGPKIPKPSPAHDGTATDPHGGKTPSDAHPHTTSTDTHATDDVATHSTKPTNDATSTPDGDASAHGDATTDHAATDASSTVIADGARIDDSLDPIHSRDGHPAGDRIEAYLRARGGVAFPESDVLAALHPDAPFSTSALPGASDREPNFGMSRSPAIYPGAPSDGIERVTQPLLRPRAADKSSNTTKGGLRHATADDLAGVWEGSVIPMDSIPGPTRLLTPGVGRVRIVIQRGEIFEGRLYAVGQGRIWIDTDVGRLALLSEQVQRIEHLNSKGGTPGLGAPGSQDLAGLPRVRVHTPGGTFYGKVIARDDGTVTLITDEGARVMLESYNVEAAPTGVRSVVVKPVGKH